MTPEEYNWRINFVKDRYDRYNLTFEQAEKIYLFEEEKTFHSTQYYFSPWEEFDYELDNFQKILDEKQFKKFVSEHKNNIKQYEKHLIESDQLQTKYISYYNDLLAFYEQNYLPDFFKEQLFMYPQVTSDHKLKVEYLKSEYKNFLEGLKVHIISSHYRHNRLFQPNTLQVALLRHKLHYLIPSFSYFKQDMDEPTKVVANFLLDKFQRYNERFDNLFKRKAQESAAFVKSIKRKHFGSPKNKGYHVIITQTEEQQKEDQIMFAVLMDVATYNSTLLEKEFPDLHKKARSKPGSQKTKINPKKTKLSDR